MEAWRKKGSTPLQFNRNTWTQLQGICNFKFSNNYIKKIRMGKSIYFNSVSKVLYATHI